jgi:hypothetical protein
MARLNQRHVIPARTDRQEAPTYLQKHRMMAVRPIHILAHVEFDTLANVELWPSGIQFVREIDRLDIPELGTTAG